ncbi:hypothetical protein [Mucilaginibacter paludis]|uniref:hypothetical protein n=1 Tax=Mucilaginibacter paludis TaxID=423351 RepID=UPI0002EFED26|nr:hypothetical protein [Mucilaginibacter paludis]
MQSATYYNYDLDGNVKTLWQQIGGLGLKRVDYEYDLVSGKVNFVGYQQNKADQFITSTNTMPTTGLRMPGAARRRY